MQTGIILSASSASLWLWHAWRAPNQLDPSAINCRSGGSDNMSLQAWFQKDLRQYWWGAGMLFVDILELTLIIWKCWGFHWHFLGSYETLRRAAGAFADLPWRWIRPLVWGSSKVWRFSSVRTIIFQNLFKVFSPCRVGNSTGVELNWWQLSPLCILIWEIPWLIKTLKAAKCCSFSDFFFPQHTWL